MDRLSQWLQDKDMSAYRLAKILGCSQTYLSLIKQGKRTFGPRYWAQFVQEFGLSELEKLTGINFSEDKGE